MEFPSALKKSPMEPAVPESASARNETIATKMKNPFLTLFTLST